MPFPLPFIPEDLGFGGAVFADAGSVWGSDADSLAQKYLNAHGQNCPGTAGPNTPGVGPCWAGTYDNAGIRASVGGSLIWNSPIGPLRADFGYALLKQSFDQTEVFRFGAATRF